MNYLVVIGFVAIIASLGAAMIFMIKGDRDQPEGAPRARNMARALAFRVGFSIVLFLCLLLAWKLGYIQPTGIPIGR